MLALWNLPGDPDTAVGAEAFGADAIVTSINEALGRIERMLIPAALDGPVPEAPAEDLARTAAIEATAVRDGHLRAALDTLAVRAAEVFDVVAAGDMVAAKKPAPDIYLLALERLGVAADAALAFEDSRNGLEAAWAAGLRVVVTPGRFTAGEDFTGADRVVDVLPALSELLAPAR